jgi:hypothetical protein
MESGWDLMDVDFHFMDHLDVLKWTKENPELIIGTVMPYKDHAAVSIMYAGSCHAPIV